MTTTTKHRVPKFRHRTLPQAIEEVKALFLERAKREAPWEECELVLWYDGAPLLVPHPVGVRVAEVTVTASAAQPKPGQHHAGTIGASWMQDDADTFAVCAAAERCIIERMVTTASSDERQEAEVEIADRRLLYLAFGSTS